LHHATGSSADSIGLDSAAIGLTHALKAISIAHINVNMKTANKTIKTYTIDPEIDEYVAATKGECSASERVNSLLKRAMLQERDEKLETEAAAFFATVQGKRRKSTLDFQEAALRTFSRD
jgi:hypothetical protein